MSQWFVRDTMLHRQYSPIQILHGLHALWKDEIGVHPDFDLGTNMIQYLRANPVFDEMDLADILVRIERFFGFSCGLAEWDDLFHFELSNRNPTAWKQDIVPALTFGLLADFIAQRAQVKATFEPIPILGNHCATAGIFVGMMQLASRIAQVRKRFAPRTPILEVMRGCKLDRFWTHLRWMTLNKIPELPSTWRWTTNQRIFWCVLILIILLGLASATANPSMAFVALFFAVFLYLLGAVHSWLVNPLPSSVVTFRDLAMLIDRNGEQKQEAQP